VKSEYRRPADFSEEERFVAKQVAQEDLYFFSRWMFLQRRGFPWARNWHHREICDALMKVYRGEILRLIITIPPRYSKTELAMVNFISWTLGHVPDAEFIYTSYSGHLASNYSGETRDLITHEAYAEVFPDVYLANDAKAAWRTTRGGALYAVGTGGSVTGMGAGKFREEFGGAIIIDDPHKADEARSDTIREGVIEWYQNTLQSRVNSPRTPIILIMQRLHERDLAGWLLSGGSGEHWEHLSLPALAEEADEHRQPGEALWPAKHTREKLEEMRAAMPYTFAGQYQQSPSAPEGNIFKPDQLQVVDAVPAGDIKWARGWDLASVTDDGDWTAGGKLGRLADGRFVIGDMARFQRGPDERDAAIVNTAGLDGKSVRVGIPQDPGQAGKTQVTYLTRRLAGFKVVSSPETGDKVTRAEPFAAQVNVGNVLMVRGPWNETLVNEMRMFPNGANDDQVDALSRAFAEVMAPRTSWFG
jgi:predicted phage terminase large subunit-like protein